MRRMLARKLREDGLKLRKMAADKASEKQLLAEKESMLGDVYRLLALTLGVPPTEFSYTLKDKDGKIVSTKTYTPQRFYKEFAKQRPDQRLRDANERPDPRILQAL